MYERRLFSDEIKISDKVFDIYHSGLLLRSQTFLYYNVSLNSYYKKAVSYIRNGLIIILYVTLI